MWSPSCGRGVSSVVFEPVDVPGPGPRHCSHIADYIYNVCPLSDSHVGPSVLVCDVERRYFFAFWPYGRNLLCSCLVRVKVSASHVISGGTQGMYTCFLGHSIMLPLKISQCYHNNR